MVYFTFNLDYVKMKNKCCGFFPFLLCYMVLYASCGNPPPPVKDAAVKAQTKVEENPESAALRMFLTDGSFLCVDVQGGAREMIGTRFTFSNGVILVQNRSIQKEVPFDIDFAMQDFKGSKLVGVLLVNNGQEESVQVIDDNAMIMSWNGESVKLGLERESNY